MKIFWNKRVLPVFLLVIVLVLSGCAKDEPQSEDTSGSNNVEQSKVKGKPLRIGTQPTQIGVPIQYAIDHGLYDEAGLEVELILFPTGAPINEALAAEQLDIAANGMASVFALASGDNYWLGDTLLTFKGLGVYVRPDSPILDNKGMVDGYPGVYGSIETIKGLTVLGPLGTSSQFNTVAWTKLFGLSSNDYNMLNMDFGPATQAFLAGEGDAIASGGPPYVYELEAAGLIQAANLTDVSGMKVTDGILARKEVVVNRRDDVKKFLEVTYKVIDEFYSDDDMVAEYCLGFYNDNGKDYTMEMMKQEVDDKDFIGKEEFGKTDYRFGSTMIGMGGFYVEDGKIEKELQKNIIDAMYPELLEEIYGIKLPAFESK